MIPAPMKLFLSTAAAVAVALAAGACGTQKITVASENPLHAGALLFNQRCSGCHTLSYAAARGSAANVRSAQFNNGPNFNIRCERPVNRVLYAIENGGFSGQIMPQNIVVGQQAREVAQFVATYAGRAGAKRAWAWVDQVRTTAGRARCWRANQTTPSSTPTPDQHHRDDAARRPPVPPRRRRPKKKTKK